VVVDIAEERLIRRAPLYPLPLGRYDRDYIAATFQGVERVFGVKAKPALPPEMMPGRALMRRLLELRRSLKPETDEQRGAHGRLSSAIMLLDVASAMDAELRGVGRR
jgi:hypothetical protein